MKNLNLYIAEKLKLNRDSGYNMYKEIFSKDFIVLIAWNEIHWDILDKFGDYAYENIDSDDVIFVLKPDQCEEYIDSDNEDIEIRFIPDKYKNDIGKFEEDFMNGKITIEDLEIAEI